MPDGTFDRFPSAASPGRPLLRHHFAHRVDDLLHIGLAEIIPVAGISGTMCLSRNGSRRRIQPAIAPLLLHHFIEDIARGPARHILIDDNDTACLFQGLYDLMMYV